MSTALSGGISSFSPWSAVSSGLGALGSIGAGIASASSSKKVMAMQMQLAREQMSFQERMSNTAHQREVKDLIAAGLNPVLSANGGASSPSGAMAVLGEAPGTTGINTALSYKHMNNETKLRQSQEELNSANSANALSSANYTNTQDSVYSDWQPRINAATESNILANTARAFADISNSKRLTDAQVSNLLSDTQGKRLSNQFNQKGSDFYSTGYGKFIYGLGQTINSLRGLH